MLLRALGNKYQSRSIFLSECLYDMAVYNLSKFCVILSPDGVKTLEIQYGGHRILNLVPVYILDTFLTA